VNAACGETSWVRPYDSSSGCQACFLVELPSKPQNVPNARASKRCTRGLSVSPSSDRAPRATREDRDTRTPHPPPPAACSHHGPSTSRPSPIVPAHAVGCSEHLVEAVVLGRTAAISRLHPHPTLTTRPASARSMHRLQRRGLPLMAWPRALANVELDGPAAALRMGLRHNGLRGFVTAQLHIRTHATHTRHAHTPRTHATHTRHAHTPRTHATHTRSMCANSDKRPPAAARPSHMVNTSSRSTLGAAGCRDEEGRLCVRSRAPRPRLVHGGAS
jgi:hypothetical protein